MENQRNPGQRKTHKLFKCKRVPPSGGLPTHTHTLFPVGRYRGLREIGIFLIWEAAVAADWKWAVCGGGAPPLGKTSLVYVLSSALKAALNIP